METQLSTFQSPPTLCCKGLQTGSIHKKSPASSPRRTPHSCVSREDAHVSLVHTPDQHELGCEVLSSGTASLNMTVEGHHGQTVESRLCAVETSLKDASLPEVHKLIHESAKLHAHFSARLSALEEEFNAKEIAAKTNFEERLRAVEETLKGNSLLERHMTVHQQIAGVTKDMSKLNTIFEDEPGMVKGDFESNFQSETRPSTSRERLENRHTFQSLVKSFECKLRAIDSKIDVLSSILTVAISEDGLCKSSKEVLLSGVADRSQKPLLENIKQLGQNSGSFQKLLEDQQIDDKVGASERLSSGLPTDLIVGLAGMMGSNSGDSARTTLCSNRKNSQHLKTCTSNHSGLDGLVDAGIIRFDECDHFKHEHTKVP